MTLSIENNSIHFLFSTPVLKMKWPAAEKYNQDLAELILGNQSEAESRQLSNEGGWQSNDDLFDKDVECITKFKEWLGQCYTHIYEVHNQGQFVEKLRGSGLAVNYKLNAWANINGPGDSNLIHNHPACAWSGVYFVRAKPDSGSVAFLDPRLSANMNGIGNELVDLFRETVNYVDPVENLAVIFPAWIQHFVSPNRSGEDRISIAFNNRVSIAKQ